MVYFNGGIHGRNTAQGYIAPEPTTAIYCDDCAREAIPLPQTTRMNEGREHWDTGFRWAPYYGGETKCHKCERKC